MATIFCKCGHFRISHQKFWDMSLNKDRPEDHCIHPDKDGCSKFELSNLSHLELKYEEQNETH